MPRLCEKINHLFQFFFPKVVALFKGGEMVFPSPASPAALRHIKHSYAPTALRLECLPLRSSHACLCLHALCHWCRSSFRVSGVLDEHTRHTPPIVGVPLSPLIPKFLVRPPLRSGLFLAAFPFTSGLPHSTPFRVPALQASAPHLLRPSTPLRSVPGLRSLFVPPFRL